MNKVDLSEKNKKKKFILYILLCGNDGNFYDHSVHILEERKIFCA